VLIRDVGGIVRQLGFDPERFARDEIERQGGPSKCSRPFHGPTQDVVGPYTGRGNDNPWGAKLSSVLQRIMGMDFAVIREEYDRAVRTEHWGARGGWSYDFVETDWMQLRSSFPDAEFRIDHVIGLDSDDAGPNRAAVRWSLCGKHSGPGWFGSPTGADVYVMGATHAEWGAFGLRREYTLIDEVAIWKQIHLHTMAAAAAEGIGLVLDNKAKSQIANPATDDSPSSSITHLVIDGSQSSGDK